jgi:holo-[acyl-carrier protein] synthase
MVKGIGVDIIEVARIKKTTAKNNRFVEKVYTAAEIGYCRSKYRPEEHFAARFAAKEAFFKALGTGWRGGMAWTDISVENDELGKPGIILSGKALEYFKKNKFRDLHLSISHTKEYALAAVVIEA